MADEALSATSAKASAAGKDAERPVFVLVDPSLKDFIGHHFEYDCSVAKAAAEAGFHPLIFGHSQVDAAVSEAVAVDPVFRRDIWGEHPHAGALGQRLKRPLDHLLCNFDFRADMRAALARHRLPAGSVVFAHMITAKHLLAWASMLRQLTRRDITVILLLRYQTDFYANRLCRLAFGMLERSVAAGFSVRIASDSRRLASALERLTSLPVEVFPIPHTQSSPGEPAKDHAGIIPHRNPERLRFVSLGNARDEKGFFEILAAIERLVAEKEGLKGLEFVLQANDAQPDVQAAIDRFEEHRPPEATLIHQSLSPLEYRLLLDSADVVLVPYWKSIYEARTSGVFLEAVAAGKVVITTGDTWMSDQLALHGSGLLARNHDPGDLALCIRQVASNYAAMSEAARTEQHICLAAHNAATLVGQAISPPPPKRHNIPPRKIAVFYPWGDFLERRAGASLRTNCMVDVVSTQVEAVRVLQSGDAPSLLRRNVRVESHSPPARSIRWLRRLFQVSWRFLLGAKGAGEELYLWYHLEARLNPAFHRHVLEMVRWADVVILEYSFWGSVVQAACHAHGVPCILTNHDIIPNQIRHSSLLRRLVESRERDVLRRADHVVCVSEDDAGLLKHLGIEIPHTIPNPADLSRLKAELPREPWVILQQLYKLDLPPAPICLFVGSRFSPNLIAVERIRSLAMEMARVGDNLTFVLVGGCADAGIEGAVHALGMVDEVVLLALYKLAQIVLIPLPYGTGASLKTIEALAAGKPVLGTSVGFRGYPVRPGVDAVIEDDLDLYPTFIRELLADPARCDALGAAARRFAEPYDFRQLFQGYMPLLGLEPLSAVEIARMQAQAVQQVSNSLRGNSQLGHNTSESERGLSNWASRRSTFWEMFRAGRYHEIAAAVALTEEVKSAELHFLMAQSLHNGNIDLIQALEHYNRALIGGYDRYWSLVGRGRLYRDLDRRRSAIKDFIRAVALRPFQRETPGHLRNIGALSMRPWPADRGPSHPRDWLALREKFWEMFQTGHYAEIIAAASTLTEEAKSGELHFLLAQSLHNGRIDLAQALEHYDLALLKKYQRYWSLAGRARLYRDLGRRRSAAKDYLRAASLRPFRRESLGHLRKIASLALHRPWLSERVGPLSQSENVTVGDVP